MDRGTSAVNMSRLYIGNLSYDTKERDLESFFRGYGRIDEIMLKNGYAFVELGDERDADDASHDLNGKKLMGRRITVEIAKGKPRGSGGGGGGRDSRSSRRGKGSKPVRTNYRILVDNLSSRISWQDLKDYMREAGEVTYAEAHAPYKNEGEVEFASLRDMKRAIKMFDDAKLNGRRIYVREDKETRRKRSPSGSRSRSRESRSRSRSASRKKDGDGRKRSRSRDSRSASRKRSASRSRSRSPQHKESKKDYSDDEKRRSRSRSRSRSKSKRSASRSASREGDNGKKRRSYSPEN